MSIAGDELALSIINDSRRYARRVAIAKNAVLREPGRGTVAQDAAMCWLREALLGAKVYEQQFGSYGVSCFTPIDILEAAIWLAEYYTNHAQELERKP